MALPSVFLFDWGDTLMHDDPTQAGPMSHWPQVRTLPGAQQVLAWAAQRGQVGIASGATDSDAVQIRAALTRAELGSRIGPIFCRRDLGYGKTDPRFWQSIVAALQIPAEHIAMIGDSYQSDVAPAHAAGIHAIWFNWRNETPQSCPIITKLQELPRLFGGNLIES